MLGPPELLAITTKKQPQITGKNSQSLWLLFGEYFEGQGFYLVRDRIHGSILGQD